MGVCQQPAAIVTGEIHRLAPKVFQQERHAPERTLRQAIGNRTAGHALLHLHNGIERRVACRHGINGGVQQLGRRDLACGDPACQFGCIPCAKIADHHIPRFPNRPVAACFAQRPKSRPTAARGMSVLALGQLLGAKRVTMSETVSGVSGLAR